MIRDRRIGVHCNGPTAAPNQAINTKDEDENENIMDFDHAWQFVYRPVTLVFRTVHWDKAGETFNSRVVRAEVADVDAEGTALLVTRQGIPILAPVARLYLTNPDETRIEAQTYFAAHEIVRNFHPHAGEPLTTRHSLDRTAAEELLTQTRQRR